MYSEWDKIIEVATKYGWQSHSGFTKAFKREFGFYPSLLGALKMSIESSDVLRCKQKGRKNTVEIKDQAAQSCF